MIALLERLPQRQAGNKAGPLQPPHFFRVPSNHSPHHLTHSRHSPPVACNLGHPPAVPCFFCLFLPSASTRRRHPHSLIPLPTRPSLPVVLSLKVSSFLSLAVSAVSHISAIFTIFTIFTISAASAVSAAFPLQLRRNLRPFPSIGPNRPSAVFLYLQLSRLSPVTAVSRLTTPVAHDCYPPSPVDPSALSLPSFPFLFCPVCRQYNN